MPEENDPRVIRLEPTPNYVAQPLRPVPVARVKLHPRNHHARELARRGGTLAAEVKMPEFCPLCKSDTIVEVESQGAWWWRCETCTHMWAPIRKTD